MSVALVVEGPGVRYLPVTTEAVFAAHWLPACRALGLVWVPQVQLGLDLTPAVCGPLIAELDAVVAWWEGQDGAPLARAQALVAAVRALPPGAVAFIA